MCTYVKYNIQHSNYDMCIRNSLAFINTICHSSRIVIMIDTCPTRHARYDARRAPYSLLGSVYCMSCSPACATYCVLPTV